MAKERFEELLGPYLLGDLTVEEERELERHLGECSACGRDLDDLRQTHDQLRWLATLRAAEEERAAEEGPPTGLKGKILAQVMGELPSRSARGRRIWVPAAAALLVFAFLGVGFFRAFTEDPDAGLPLTATALAPQAGGQVQVEDVGENLQVELEVWDMPALEHHGYYEMWYYAKDDGRISCGTFRVGSQGDASVNLSAPANATEYPEIEITREPDDGDPATSGEVVLEGSLRDV